MYIWANELSMRKIIITILGILLLGVIIGYLYIYQDHRDIATEQSVFQLTAENLTLDFQQNPDAANKKYLNQVIEVSGKVTEVTDSIILLQPGVFAATKDINPTLSVGDRVKIKGRCIGYDELFGEVKMDQCVIK